MPNIERLDRSRGLSKSGMRAKLMPEFKLTMPTFLLLFFRTAVSRVTFVCVHSIVAQHWLAALFWPNFFRISLWSLNFQAFWRQNLHCRFYSRDELDLKFDIFNLRRFRKEILIQRGNRVFWICRWPDCQSDRIQLTNQNGRLPISRKISWSFPSLLCLKAFSPSSKPRPEIARPGGWPFLPIYFKMRFLMCIFANESFEMMLRTILRAPQLEAL